MEIIRDVVWTDPFSADLTYGMGLHQYAIGDHAGANATFAAFARLAHNSPKGQAVASALEKLK